MYSKYETKMTSDSQIYETPDELFLPLHKEFNFELDVCANENNHKVEQYYDEKDDCFTKDWKLTSWMNPEFVKVGKFIKKAYEESVKHGSTIVCLTMVKSNTNWWRDIAMKAKEIRFINQKVQFKGTPQGLRFPCCLIIFSPHDGETKFSVFQQDFSITKCLECE
ncbi:adenine methyltransferase [Nitrososphaeria virus YSH_462411]|uniref:Adenine methyltransferase n=1 Tax=Nitrososphaeria virus YSH_462411 TaxID=3071321 RepID=A0A976YEY4_9CAUD|nr:adenine methyltransferase [Yangshan Harbor Nitrososphaeria virus]UVF62335.1 adenine methyltransferase [Nitrososphaeria virus YSH_462411]